MFRTIACVLALLLCGRVVADEALYSASIKPLLAKKCVACHGPVKQEAGLRLDTAALIVRGGEDGAVVVKAKPAESRLLARVRSADPHERMPPEGEGEPLTPAQIELLATWIERGAVGPIAEKALATPKEHWAYQLPVKAALPADVPAEWATNPVDQLLAGVQRERGVVPAEVADKATLLRRVTFDLTGLPPTPAELHEFLADESPSAWPRVVDRLLDSPAYGERWGRHWMDVWRYSDWDGYQKELRGSQRHIWRWRDWIIESLNADRGYDQMVREMLAADELAPDDIAALRATGFLARNYYKFNRQAWLDHTVEHTAKAFLGMTLDCAKCHDHKYDPLTQKEHYGFRAIFEPHEIRADRIPGQPNVELDSLPRAFDARPDEPTYLFIRGNDKQPDKEHPLTPVVPAVFGTALNIKPVPMPRTAYYPALNESIIEETRAAARQAVSDAEAALVKSQEMLIVAAAALDQARSAPADEGPVSAQDFLSWQFLWSDSQVAVSLAEQRLSAAQSAIPVLEARIAADVAKYREPPADDVAAMALSAAKLEREQNRLEADIALQDAELKWQQSARTKRPKDVVTKPKMDRDAAIKKRDEAIAALSKTDDKYTPLGVESPRVSTGRRLALANWITGPDNPLAARVAVNHVWHRHFGRPIVDNLFDFGLRSPRPALGDVLDWLAVDFQEHGWSFKHLHRTIVTSRAYRLASSTSTEFADRNRAVDPDNALHWKAELRRLEAEAVRDSVLAVTGGLDLTRGGPDIAYGLEHVARRSLYFQHAYEKQMTFLLLFDAASPNECYRRSESIVPQQALALANSSLVHANAEKLAKSLENESPEEFVTQIYERILGRSPWEEERLACREFLQTGDHARRDLIRVLMNHNDFVTVR
ncbi:MAG: PSD1 and planctomycete cytochrome C domain-containing protein [Planctomycetaceae bacterium]|nr:PSD1 and planctomycete cytochrome C domain-containing protein [Planctomycetaceae bacterium]